MTVGSCAWADNGETKGLITPPPMWVSAQLLYVWVSAQQQSRWCSQNLRRPFLRVGRFHYLFTLRGTIFPLPGVIKNVLGWVWLRFHLKSMPSLSILQVKLTRDTSPSFAELEYESVFMVHTDSQECCENRLHTSDLTKAWYHGAAPRYATWAGSPVVLAYIVLPRII